MTETVTTQQVLDALVEIARPATLQEIVDFMTSKYPNRLYKLSKMVSSSLNMGMNIGCVKTAHDKYEIVKNLDDHSVSSDEELDFTESGYIVNNEVNANESSFSLKTVTSAHPGCWGSASSSCCGSAVRIAGGVDKASVSSKDPPTAEKPHKEGPEKQQRESSRSRSSSSGCSLNQKRRL